MGSLFSKRQDNAPPSRVTAHDQAVLQLKGQRDRMKQYMRRNEVAMERDREVAKALLQTGKKDRALLLLKKKRFQEQTLERILKQLDNIEQMVHDLEFAEIEAKVVEGLKIGNESLKTMHRLLSVEDVEKILDETKEAVEYQHEIDSILSGQLSDTDMASVEAELDEIMRLEEDIAGKLPDAPDVQLEEPNKDLRDRMPAKSHILQREKEMVAA